MTATTTEVDTEIKEKREVKLEFPKKWLIIFHNDDKTPMDFVVQLLVALYHYEPHDAVKLMLEIHNEGKAVAGSFSKEVAETKHKETMAVISKAQFELMVTLERED